jgi:sulfate transporter 4
MPVIDSIIAGADQFKWPPFLLGCTILVILLVMKHVGKAKKELRFIRAAGPLTGLALGTIIAKVFHPPSITLVRLLKNEILIFFPIEATFFVSVFRN